MEYELIFHTEANKEILESEQWYFKRSKKAHKAFINSFIFAIDLVQKDPFAFPIVYDNKRRVILTKFPFSVIYTISNKTIFVLSIFHHSRNPFIWKER